MTLKLISYISDIHDAPLQPGQCAFSEPFCPVVGAAHLGELQAQYHHLSFAGQAPEFIGFENAARPLFIDPLPQRVLARLHPQLVPVRLAAAQSPLADRILVPQHILTEYQAMRAGLGEDHMRRVMDWLERIDIVTPPRGRRDLGLEDSAGSHVWRQFVSFARSFELFQAMPPDIFFADAWPPFSTYIMRAAFFVEFAGAALQVLVAFLDRPGGAQGLDIQSLAGRLLGAYVQYKVLCNPCLRLAELPMLGIVQP